MKRIGILTAGGDTPALNATLYGAVTRACQRHIEMVGFIKGFSSLLYPHVPHVYLNPLFIPIPELTATRGGTILGSSRDYVDPEQRDLMLLVKDRLARLGIEGLICIGGDGTLNGMQALAEHFPTVLAPKTIDNDLGLNYPHEADEWTRVPNADGKGFTYGHPTSSSRCLLDQMVNYATPGYATAVFVSARGVQCIRTTAESHRRIAIIEVMGRHSGYLALGMAYGQPDITLVPEHPVDLDRLVARTKEIYDLQKNVVIVCAEGVVDSEGRELGAASQSFDPAGNIQLSGAAEALRHLLIQRLQDDYFTSKRRNESAKAAIFVRKVGHTQRGGPPILFDRFYATQLGGQAVDMLLEGQANTVAVLQWSTERGFYLDSVAANVLRDRFGLIHARRMHPSFYDPERLRPSQTGIEYLKPIFTDCISGEDLEMFRTGLFHPGNLTRPYHSVNTDMHKRIRYLEPPLQQ
jgi:6-phosphofructokinase 1